MSSYLSSSGGTLSRIRELAALWQKHGRGLENEVQKIGELSRSLIAVLETTLGRPAHGLEVLEIGPGQRKPLMYALGTHNRYTGIDIEIAAERFSAAEAVRVLRNNGPLRAIKTTGRHLLGIDRRYAEALRQEFGVEQARGKLIEADASDMPFDDASFDAIVSVSVFEHLSDPPAVMREVSRVLRPGGVACVMTHVYTSVTGAHDPRTFVDMHALPLWAHLRPQHADVVVGNSYVNKISLKDWLAAFAEAWPGSSSVSVGDRSKDLTAALAELRAVGELADYEDDELLFDTIRTTWRKP